MTTPELTTKPSRSRFPVRDLWLAPKMPESGAVFFLQLARNVTIAIGMLWLFDRPSPDPTTLLIGGGIPALFLVLALGFYLWERRLRRQTRA